MTTSIVQVRNITKAFKQQTVLNDINFSIQSGEIVALLGENGAGKTTLINIMNALLPADKGDVTLFSKKPDNKDVRARIGTMFQQNFLIERLIVKELIDFARSHYEHPMATQQILEIAQVAEIQDKLVTSLSGGQQRRLSYALALAGNPDLIFLDEPTAAMDAYARHRFWNSIAQLKAQGKTIIVTSHYLEELQNIATRFIILKNSRMVFDGSLEELRRTQGMISLRFRTTLSSNILKSLPGISTFQQLDNLCTISTNDINPLLRALVPYLEQIEGLVIEQTSLEELFNALYQSH